MIRFLPTAISVIVAYSATETEQRHTSGILGGNEFIYRHSQDLNLPIELTIKMPKTDQGKRGYSKAYVERLVRMNS